MIEFNARVSKGCRITIPKWLIDSANIQEGDVLKVALLHKVVVQVEEKPQPKKKKS
jgi:bifunctional DNA-binding transcriptional regulator/antitoxin component of YhaV-PrlF toxin-antitoxin module